MNITGETKVGGVFEFELVRNGKVVEKWEERNLVTNQGLNALLNTVFAGGAQTTTWYLGLFDGPYTPTADVTAATIAAIGPECTAYSEATRPEWVEAAASGQQITNSANKATFTITDPKTIYGAFLVSASGKGSTTGTLFSATRFSQSRSVVATDQLLVTYTIQASSATV